MHPGCVVLLHLTVRQHCLLFSADSMGNLLHSCCLKVHHNQTAPCDTAAQGSRLSWRQSFTCRSCLAFNVFYGAPNIIYKAAALLHPAYMAAALRLTGLRHEVHWSRQCISSAPNALQACMSALLPVLTAHVLWAS